MNQFMNPFRKRFGANGDKVVAGAYVMFSPPGPNESEQRQEMLAAFGMVRNRFGLVVPGGLQIACEVRPIADVHDCSQIESVMREMLEELGKSGKVQAVGVESNNSRFTKVQVAWATIF